MLYDSIMFGSGLLFAVLFLFLLCINLVIVVSFFVKKQYKEFQPFVSIVVPTFNEEKNIEQCLSAIFASDYPKLKYEVLVADDGSTDSTINVVKKFNNVKIVCCEHKGKAAALNTGFKKASAEFVLSVDADTFVGKDCLKNIILPLKENNVGIVAGLIKVQNKNCLLGIFQNVEYCYSNLIRKSFSTFFNQGVWLYGAIACYRKLVLENAGWLKSDTLTEDLDISLEVYNAGFRTVVADNAYACTVVPSSIGGLLRQRVRWYTGNLQCIKKHWSLFSLKSSPSVVFTFVNQLWWCFFSLLFFPVIVAQIFYWLPNSSSIDLFLYFFRWFSLAGPLFVVYKLPVWGFSIYNFFGVWTGIMTSIVLVISIKSLKENLFIKNAVGVFFYFPYTIILNISSVLSIFKYKFYKHTFFIR